MPTHVGDETCPACVVAGDFIFLAHHGGGFEHDDVAAQLRAALERMRETLESVGASLDDMVQLNLYLKHVYDFEPARDVFPEFFKNGFPARMTTVTEFIDQACLCQIDGMAYKARG